MTVVIKTPAAAYATKPNIVHPRSNDGTATGEAQVVAAEAKAVTDLNDEFNVGRVPGEAASVVVTTATIKRGR